MNDAEIYPHEWSGDEGERAYLSGYYQELGRLISAEHRRPATP